ncbi:MAG: SDR family oxidoreductase [Nocardioidaceae bacterium]
MRLAVAGGTGMLGHHVVEVARRDGHDVVVLDLSEGVDLLKGTGLTEKLVDVDAVVDVTSTRTQKRAKAEAFFGTITRNLLDAETAAGVGHHIALSIVGVDVVPSGYYQGKLLQERIVMDSKVPWSILRSTQFHEFAAQVLDYVRFGPFSLVPRMLSQPVAAVDVAGILVQMAESGPAGRVPELAGPERHQMVDLSRRVSRARGLGRRVIPLHVPGALGKGLRSGALIPTGDGPRGRLTFAEWLDA